VTSNFRSHPMQHFCGTNSMSHFDYYADMLPICDEFDASGALLARKR